MKHVQNRYSQLDLNDISTTFPQAFHVYTVLLSVVFSKSLTKAVRLSDSKYKPRDTQNGKFGSGMPACHVDFI